MEENNGAARNSVVEPRPCDNKGMAWRDSSIMEINYDSDNHELSPDETLISSGGNINPNNLDPSMEAIYAESTLIDNDSQATLAYGDDSMAHKGPLNTAAPLVAKSRLQVNVPGTPQIKPPSSPSTIGEIHEELSSAKKRKTLHSHTVEGEGTCMYSSLPDLSKFQTSTPAKEVFSLEQCLECNRSTIAETAKVKCNFCKRPVCDTCSAMAVMLLSSMDRTLLGNYLFTCDMCKGILAKGEQLYATGNGGNNDRLSAKMDKLADRLSQMTTIIEKNNSQMLDLINTKADKEYVDRIAEDVTSLKRENKELERALEDLRGDMRQDAGASHASEMMDRKLTDLRNELEEEKRRETNLIFFKMTESSLPNAQDRRKADEDMLYTFLTEVLGISRPPKPKVLIRTTVGAQSKYTGPKPLKAIFQSTADRNLCFERYLDVKRTEQERLGEVNIIPDRTKQQNETRKQAYNIRRRKLQAELEERTNSGEKDLVIQGNRIVKVAQQTDQPFRGGRASADGL